MEEETERTQRVYTRYNMVIDPETMDTLIYLEDDTTEGWDGTEDYLRLSPTQSDIFSTNVIFMNANRKKLRVSTKTDGFKSKFRRKSQ